MGQNAQCYMSSVKVTGLVVIEWKILKVFTIYGLGRHLGKMTRILQTNARYPIPNEDIWLKSAQWSKRRSHLKMLTDRLKEWQSDDEGPLYPKSSHVSLWLRCVKKTTTNIHKYVQGLFLPHPFLVAVRSKAVLYCIFVVSC